MAFVDGQILTAAELNSINAATATALQTPRAINGVNFDGTAAITIPPTGAVLSADLASTTDPTKGAALVGFLQAGTGAVGRTVQQELRATVNVMQFGAVGSGTVDDSPAFNAAIAALPAAGGTVVFPAGYIFAVNLTILKPGVRIQGPGVTNGEDIPTQNYLTHFNAALPVIQIGNDTGIVSGITLQDMQLYGANAGSIGLYFAGGAYRCNYGNVYISNFATNCIKFKGGTTYPCAYIRGVNVGISPNVSGSDGYFIDGAVPSPSYTTAIYLTNFDISSPNTSGHAVRINNATGRFSQGYIQALNLGGVITTSNGVFNGSNVTIDTDTPTNVIFETSEVSTQLTDSLSGSVTLSGKWNNGTPTTYDAGGSSYNYYHGQFNWPIITGSQIFPDPSASGYASDASAAIYGSGSSGSRTLNLQGSVIDLAANGYGTQVQLLNGYFRPFNDNVMFLGQASNRWAHTYTADIQLSGAPSVGAAGTVTLGGTVATTVGAAGSAAALPANPAGYLIINVAGTQMKIPYYNN